MLTDAPWMTYQLGDQVLVALVNLRRVLTAVLGNWSQALPADETIPRTGWSPFMKYVITSDGEAVWYDGRKPLAELITAPETGL